MMQFLRNSRMVISIKNTKGHNFLPYGKAGWLQILRYQGIAVDDDSFTLDASALKPSGFCNDRVKDLWR